MSTEWCKVCGSAAVPVDADACQRCGDWARSQIAEALAVRPGQLVSKLAPGAVLGEQFKPIIFSYSQSCS